MKSKPQVAREYFKSIEGSDVGDSFNLHDTIDQLAFNEQGLIPVVTQDVESHRVLMVAWMNKDALRNTLATKRVTYWSRSREKLWIKGETSGHTQTLVSMYFDCDGDTVLCQVAQSGAACHTGRSDCFYLRVDTDRKQLLISDDK